MSHERGSNRRVERFREAAILRSLDGRLAAAVNAVVGTTVASDHSARAIMTYLIGTDEAGYGPNLGPLVVSASVWKIDDSATDSAPASNSPSAIDLYKRLRGVVCKSSPAGEPPKRLAIADSKSLYSPATGLAALERGVLAALALTGYEPTDWLGIWQALDANSIAHLPTMPWHVDYDLRLPLAADATSSRDSCHESAVASNAPARAWWHWPAAPSFPKASIARPMRARQQELGAVEDHASRLWPTCSQRATTTALS